MKILNGIRARAQYLEFRLSIFILLAFIGGGVFIGLIAMDQIRQQMHALMVERQESDVLHLAQDIEREVSQRMKYLEQVSSVIAPALASKDAPALQSFLEARPVFSSHFNRGIFVIGADAVAIASAPSVFGRIGINYGERDYAIETLQSGRTAIGRPVLGKPLGQPVLVMAAPVRLSQGKIVGAIAGVTDLNQPSFVSRLKDFTYAENQQIRVIDTRSGLVVASNVPGQVMQSATGYQAATNKVSTKESNDSVVTTIPIAPTWILEFSSPQQVSSNAIQTFLQHIGLLFALGILLVTLIAVWSVRALLRPLRQTSRVLKGWQSEQLPFDPSLASRQDEVGLLARSFNDVFEQIASNRESLENLSALMNAAGGLAKVGGWELDVRKQTLYWSPETYRIHEIYERTTPTVEDAINFYAPESQPIVSQAVKDSLEKGTSFDIEVKLVTAVGNVIWVRAMGRPLVENGEVIKLIGAIQNVSERKRDALIIEDLAYKDSLTNLPNRRSLTDRLQEAIEVGQAQGHLSALIAIDLDNFKSLNDSYGHYKGDLLLSAVAHVLRSAVSENETVARVGADEFMVILTNLGSEPEVAAKRAKTIAENLCAKLNGSYQLGRIQHYSTASLGVVAFGWDAEVPEEPMKRADLALTYAKASGYGMTFSFEPHMQAEIERRVELEAAIRQGLINNEFTLHYQAQVVERGDGDRHIVGAETLIRWAHPEQGMISPAEFIPVAEASGLILDIGSFVLEEACEQLARWADDSNLNHLTLAVNVSARQFHETRFVESVIQALAITGAPAQRLKLELTEGMLVSNIDDVVLKMKTLKTLGVSFALDDFGTGYSSLSYLKSLPLDQLKIDQSFVREILHDANDAAIARTVIGLADSMGLAIIAEGVETQEQRQFLASEGCIAYQGYLFSRPVPIEDFESLALADLHLSSYQTLAT